MSIFGGTTLKNTLTKDQKGLIRTMADTLQSEWGQPADVYGGPTVAGRTGLMNLGLDMASGGNSMQPYINQASQQALSGAEDPAAVMARYQSALGPAQLEFQRAQNEIGNRYGSAYGTSGPMAEMMGRSAAEYGMGLNSLLGELTYNDRNAALDRQAGAIAPAAAAQTAGMQNIQDIYGMGEADRAVTGQEYASDYAKWLSGQWYNNPALGFISPVLGTQAKSGVQEGGLLPGLMGLVGGVANLGAAFA